MRSRLTRILGADTAILPVVKDVMSGLINGFYVDGNGEILLM